MHCDLDQIYTQFYPDIALSAIPHKMGLKTLLSF